MALKDIKNTAETAQIRRIFSVCEAHGIDVQVAGHAACDPMVGVMGDVAEMIAEKPITQLSLYAASNRRPLGSLTLEHGLGPDRHVIAASANATVMDLLIRADINPQPPLICASSPADASYFLSAESLAAFGLFTRERAVIETHEVIWLLQAITERMRMLEIFLQSTVDLAVQTGSALNAGAARFVSDTAELAVAQAQEDLSMIAAATSGATAAMMAILPPPGVPIMARPHDPQAAEASADINTIL